MIFGDLEGLKLPDISLTGEEKPRKKLTQESCPDQGSNPGPLRDRRACYRLTHSGGRALSCYKRTLFRLTNAGYVSKYHELIRVVENKDTHRLLARKEYTPRESHIQNPTRHTTLLWDRTHFFKDNCGRLAATEALFWGVRVAEMDVCFNTCDNSPDKSIMLGITDKLMTDIHSTLSLLSCQFMRYRSTDSVWFSKDLDVAMFGIFWCTKFFWQPTSTFLRIFFQKLWVYS